MTTSPRTFQNTKRHDPALRKVCAAIAQLASGLAGATNAVLINANAIKLNMSGIERGGTVLVIRFPAAAITREEEPLQELIAPVPPKLTYHVHPSAETSAGPQAGHAVGSRTAKQHGVDDATGADA